jgi:hypothetical protein
MLELIRREVPIILLTAWCLLGGGLRCFLSEIIIILSSTTTATAGGGCYHDVLAAIQQSSGLSAALLLFSDNLNHRVILKIRPLSYFHDGHRMSLQRSSNTPSKKTGYEFNTIAGGYIFFS